MEKNIMYRIKGVTKCYKKKKKKIQALQEINLDRKNEFMILGPGQASRRSWCMLASFLEPTTGNIFVGGQRIEGPGPDRGMVFQAYTFSVAQCLQECGIRPEGIEGAGKRTGGYR